MDRGFSVAYIPSPFGYLKVEFDSKFVYSVRWTEPNNAETVKTIVNPDSTRMYELIIRKFELYWQGKAFELDIPFTHQRGTKFQERVWKALRKIPYGSTVTYKELAGMVGSPKAARAVGSACKKNEIAVIIPCHRVVKSNGHPGNYSAPDGPSIKKRLIEFEKRCLINLHCRKS